MPGTLVIKRPSRFGTLRSGIFLTELTTMQDFGTVGHSTWQLVSSMHCSTATGAAFPLTIASTSCGQASTQAWQPMQVATLINGCGYGRPSGSSTAGVT